jgi:CRISPR/Cas system-associated protein endoribonuclease Cas2
LKIQSTEKLGKKELRYRMKCDNTLSLKLKYICVTEKKCISMHLLLGRQEFKKVKIK